MIDAVRKHDRVFQTGSQQRSERRQVPQGLRVGPQRPDRQAQDGPRRRRAARASRATCPEEPLEPGLDWDRWLGPAPKRPYNSVLSPRGVHKHFPDWRHYREYSGGMMTDWGAHHFDIAQWGLDMDESGPVEIIPPETRRREKGLRYVYANGMTVIHGTSTSGKRSRHAFIGTTGRSSSTAATWPASPKRLSRSRWPRRTCTSTSRPATSATGSTASARAKGRSATWRSAPAR